MPIVGYPADLYPSGEVRSYQPFEKLESDATAGGFAIFQGGRQWKLASLKVTENNLRTRIASTQLISPQHNEYFAQMAITLSLGGGDHFSRAYFSGDPCPPSMNALVKLSNSSQKTQNCLTINPITLTVQGKPIPMMEISVTNTKSSSRLYMVQLLLALDKLGFPNSKDSDWTTSQIDNDAAKKQFIEKIGAWGSQLRDAVDMALDYSKPQDIFQKVPSIDILLAPEQTVNITSSGIYTVVSQSRVPDMNSLTGMGNLAKDVTLSQATTQIPAVLGTHFGVSYVIQKGQPNEIVNLRAIVHYPEGGLRNPETGKSASSSEWIQSCHVGSSCSVGYYFREAWELIPGDWSVELLQDSQQLFTHKFEVYLP
jgi:hypothetical protein